ncbi:hypothetical protein GCM10007881_31640 [Mesorhizobium huakuii]|nr:hypothetical protein GCM10007881_31640 [Mesorhizobium huakuii]
MGKFPTSWVARWAGDVLLPIHIAKIAQGPDRFTPPDGTGDASADAAAVRFAAASEISGQFL